MPARDTQTKDKNYPRGENLSPPGAFTLSPHLLPPPSELRPCTIVPVGRQKFQLFLLRSNTASPPFSLFPLWRGLPSVSPAPLPVAVSRAQCNVRRARAILDNDWFRLFSDRITISPRQIAQTTRGASAIFLALICLFVCLSFLGHKLLCAIFSAHVIFLFLFDAGPN